MKSQIFRLILLFSILLTSTFSALAQNSREEAIALYKQEKYKEAISSLKNVLKNNENDAEILNYLGLAYLNSDDYKEAQKFLEKAVKTNPQNSSFRSNLAYSYLLDKKLDKSQSEINKVIQQESDNANAFYIRGTSYVWENKYDEAIADADKAIDLDKSLVSAYVLKANALMFSLGKDWNNESSDEKINSLALAIKILENCPAECKEKDKSNLIRDRLESLRAFHEYFQKREAFKNKAISENSDESADNNQTSFKIISKPNPRYTNAARRENIQGNVLLAILFGSDGQIKFILVTKGLKNGLNEEAVKAAKKIKFEPATKNGKPISVVRVLQYNFKVY